MTTRPKRIRFFAGCIGLITGLAMTAQAQPDAPDSTNVQYQNPQKNVVWIRAGDDYHINEFSMWAGYAFDSFELWGKTPEATLGLFGIRYNRKVLDIYNTTMEYTLDVSLYAHYTYPEFTYERQKNSIKGAGVSPLGFQFNFLNHSRLQPFLKISGGFMLLSQPFPDWRGERFNFTFGAGGGLEYMVASFSSITLGYRYFHLSNGETGLVNPGIDSSFFYCGITFF